MPVTYGDSVGVIVYLKRDTYEVVKKIAEQNRDSISKTVRTIVETFVELYKGQEGEGDGRIQVGQAEG
ncbi:MAG: hypothetical protein QXY94_02600 [Archaeoglobaceae archaeon]